MFQNKLHIISFLSLILLLSNKSYSRNIEDLLHTRIDDTSIKELINSHRNKPHFNDKQLFDDYKSTVQTSKILPTPNGIAGGGERFARSVSVDGNRALIGAPTMDGTGLVFVYDFDGINWIESARLKPANISADDGFGQAVSLDGNRAVIGAYGDQGIINDNLGAAYVYEFDGVKWNEAQKLKPENLGTFGYFGWSVSLSGDRVLIGAFIDFDDFNFSGDAFIYDFDGSRWRESHNFSAGNGIDFFGYSVSLDGDKALIGAPRSGDAYIYDFNGSEWVQNQQILPNDRVNDDNFGRSVVLKDDKAYVGSPTSNFNETIVESGAVYEFFFDGIIWVQNQKIIAENADAYDNFGRSLSLYDDRLAIGAPNGLFEQRDMPIPGKSYIFNFNGLTWVQSHFFSDDNNVFDRYYGIDISLSANHMLVGQLAISGSQSGSATSYLFDGNNWNQSQHISLGETGAANSNFGYSVSLSGNLALIGAYGDSTLGSNVGAAYLFQNNGSGWILRQKLFPQDALIDGNFGSTVSLKNNRALISSGNIVDGSMGSVYVFDFNGSKLFQSQKIEPDQPVSNNKFGSSISQSNDNLLIGSYGLATVFIYEYDGSSWINSESLISNDPSDNFGYAVDLSGNRAIIGANMGNGKVNKSTGTAYIYEFNGVNWTQSQKLTALDDGSGDQFGASVSISNNRILIGTPFEQYNGGAVYAFDYNGFIWQQSQKLTEPFNLESKRFGNSVSLSGNRALIGAYLESAVEGGSGAAYIYEFDGVTWRRSNKLIANDGNRNDYFGRSVSLSNGKFLIGANRHDQNGTNSGSAYIFEIYDPANDLIYVNGFE
ncbi:hypothetical protein OS175_13300 [Marinicella sp. S1101]|uniref:hypothetical protein n=1 Tax=Marinicella marina TaxID=2996016 RepID=UPI002260A850|nr:hypothetical protein [Marinicella marina]MCX7554850.1 hypothetical protein [Marinicella marina]MDJ1141508.1 hypothetical protein [Marinicella marina]